MQALLLGLFLCVLGKKTLHDEFLDWAQAHGKQYNKFEYEQRFATFKANVQRVKTLNTNSKDAEFRLNRFADLTAEEFASQRLGAKLPAEVYATACLANGAGKTLHYSPEQVKAVPDSWDWRTTGGKGNSGIVTPVKDQGACGSCWAFSTTGVIESTWALKGNPMAQMSEQLIVDCSHGCCNITGYGPVCNAGCDGGFQWNAFIDIMTWGGLVTESDYPYTGETGTCATPVQSKFFSPIKNYTCLSGPNPADEEQLRTYMFTDGPVAIAMNAGILQFYFGGIVDPFFPNFECDPNSLDHALLIVGWGQEKNWIGEMTPYWIVKNSWGTWWGESGYFLIARNANLCGIANAVSAVDM
jgi:cathepsin F